MKTNEFSLETIWDKILTHPDFEIAHRELDALIRFLTQEIRHVITDVTNILHLGVGNGREITHFVEHLRINTYIINDINPTSLKKVTEQARSEFPYITFMEACANIEQQDVITRLRQSTEGQSLIALVGNGTLFSKQLLDNHIQEAMRPEDFFFATTEMPHEHMTRSYQIEPIYKLLTTTKVHVVPDNIKTWYDDTSHCLKMTHGEEVLLSSYKPTKEQLRERLQRAGMEEIVLQEYPDLHMLAGLFKIAPRI